MSGDNQHALMLALLLIGLLAGLSTGFPVAFDNKAASATKSGFDLRPKPPPSRVT